MKEPVGKFARWIAVIQSYNYNVKVRPVREHLNADGVSRRTYHEKTLPPDDWDELQSFECVSQDVKTESGRNSQTSKPKTNAPDVKAAAADLNDQNLWSLDALRDQQRSDTWYNDIINYLENGILPDASNKRRDILIISNCYVIDNGILFHLFTQDRRKIKNTDIRL